MIKSTVWFFIFLLAACSVQADKKKLNDKNLDSILACNGVNTEYSNLDGYYYLPDHGCIYNGQSNKMGNAFIFIIPNIDQKKDLKLREIKGIKEKIVFLIPKDYLVKTATSDTPYIPKENYKLKIFLNSGNGWIENNNVNIGSNNLNEMTTFVENRVSRLKRNIFIKREMDINQDGVKDFIEVLGEKDLLKSIIIRDGLSHKVLWTNNLLFDDSYNACNFSHFNNIAVSRNNFTLEYDTCADNAVLGKRYTTFKVDSNNEPFVIQDNYLIYDLNEDDKTPRKVNCMSSSKVSFSTYRGRCG